MHNLARLVFIAELCSALFLAALPPATMAHDGISATVRHQIENATVEIDGSTVDVAKLGSDQTATSYGSVGCSGVIVGAENDKSTDIDVLTAAHCLKSEKQAVFMGMGVVMITPDLKSYVIHFFDGDIGRYKRTVQVGYMDWALVEFHSQRPHTTVPDTNTAALSRGQHLIVFGGPESGDWLWQQAYSESGSVGQPDDENPQWDGDRVIECPGCTNGDSGAGVWTDDGKLDGIYVASYEGSASGYYTPIEEIYAP